MQTVAVIDYGASNLRSVARALAYISRDRHRVIVSDRAEEIYQADRIVFPGQGAIRQCMASLRDKSLDQVLLECLKSKPFLGLCLGLQTLMTCSAEDGGTNGLDVLPGRVEKFPEQRKDSAGNICKIPHMGWNNVIQQQPHPLWKGIESGEQFYFVHSYYVKPEQAEITAGTTEYIVDFTSAAARDNLFAVQFHPEKSQRAGLQLLGNFLQW